MHESMHDLNQHIRLLQNNLARIRARLLVLEHIREEYREHWDDFGPYWELWQECLELLDEEIKDYRAPEATLQRYCNEMVEYQREMALRGKHAFHHKHRRDMQRILHMCLILSWQVLQQLDVSVASQKPRFQRMAAVDAAAREE